MEWVLIKNKIKQRLNDDAGIIIDMYGCKSN